MAESQKLPVTIEDEMRRSYLDYAMSVIIGRAIPDVARRAQAGAPPDPLLDARAATSAGTRRTRRARASSATSSASTTRTATRRSTTRSSAWRRTSRCATRSSTGKATSGPSTATRPRPCATPRCGCRGSRPSCSPTSRRRPSTSVPNFDDSRARAARLAEPLPEPAGQRLGRHRGRHGDERAAAQPARDHRRDDPAHREPRRCASSS